MSNMVDIIQKIVQAEMRKIHTTELGSVTSIFPHTSDSDKENYACNVKLKNTELELRNVPVATQHIGLSSIPKVGDLVVLSFVNGDINQPVLVGRLYNDEDRPPVSQDGEMVYEAPYDVNEDLRRFFMKLPSGITIQLGDGCVIITAGKTSLNMGRDGDIELVSDTKVTITAKEDMEFKSKNLTITTDENVTVEAGQNLELKSTMDYTLEGMKVEIKSSTDLVLEGLNSTLTAGAQLDVKSDGLGSVEASGPLTLKGAIVNIN